MLKNAKKTLFAPGIFFRFHEPEIFKITKKMLKTGKRIFLMTPIHHHFELKGIKEEKIVENFWKVNILLVVLGIVLKINL